MTRTSDNEPAPKAGPSVPCFSWLDDESQFRCTVCGQVGTVGRCCGLDTREPLNDFISELRDLINRRSIENASKTPDFILAQYLTDCLRAWNQATQQRETWYGRDARPTSPSNKEISQKDDWR